MTLKERFGDTWLQVLDEETVLNQLLSINEELFNQRQTQEILPEAGNPDLFKAFQLTPFEDVRVVILGMDIYHTSEFYNGLAFGTGGNLNDPDTVKYAPALRTIQKELNRCYNSTAHPSLYNWAKQGVFLYNVAQTVIRGEVESHLDLWTPFTRNVFQALNRKNEIIWMLWGSAAGKYEQLITNNTHKIIKSGHPSPLNSANPLVGSGCFLECDRLIEGEPIIWTDE